MKPVVHIILNSHIDPVWLWKREQGIDEVLSTARTACDLLDEYPKIQLTRGEAWFYETVEQHDPATFARLREHVRSGRLHVVGGWYIQPDCNLASAETYLRHNEFGGNYFQGKFGVRVKTGYNVDSFGHGAFLPDFYSAAGIVNYCMLRPSPHEKQLPGEIFRWRSPNGAELLTARICGRYNTHPNILPEHLERVIAAVDPALGHIMCFCGVGDHGGGPARAEIEYLLTQLGRKDVEIRFSCPDAFFDAVRATKARLPVVEGELQHHAIGCYSACSAIKRSVRLTENRLLQTEPLLTRSEREKAWKALLFATFHDLLAGSSIASSYDAVLDSLGMARHLAWNAQIRAIRRRNAHLRPDSRQRLILDNAGVRTYRALFEAEPWVSWRGAECIRLWDEKGRPVPAQPIPGEAVKGGIARLTFPLELPAKGRKILYLDREGGNAKQRTEPLPPPEGVASLPGNGREFLGAPLRFDVLRDNTDTWSHGVNCYPAQPVRSFRQTGKFRRHFSGPLLAQSVGRFRDSKGNTIHAALRREAGFRGLRLFLRLNWSGARQIVKLVIKPSFPVQERRDGCPGGEIRRGCNGEEFPFFNYCLLSGGEHSLGVVSKDCFSCDVQPGGELRLTLLRTPYYAHHDPCRVPAVNAYRVTDQGEHEYEIALMTDPSPEDVLNEVFRQTDPVVFSESTLGVRGNAI